MTRNLIKGNKMGRNSAISNVEVAHEINNRKKSVTFMQKSPTIFL